jgi:hypothetical protein
MGRDFGAELLDVLDRWRDTHVAVRVVASTDELVAVFSGKLGSRSAAKASSLFWPVDLTPVATPDLEQPGIYAHPELLSDVRLHVGGFVIEFAQAGRRSMFGDSTHPHRSSP